jgi:hypothetical protein
MKRRRQVYTIYKEAPDDGDFVMLKIKGFDYFEPKWEVRYGKYYYQCLEK